MRVTVKAAAPPKGTERDRAESCISAEVSAARDALHDHPSGRRRVTATVTDDCRKSRRPSSRKLSCDLVSLAAKPTYQVARWALNVPTGPAGALQPQAHPGRVAVRAKPANNSAIQRARAVCPVVMSIPPCRGVLIWVKVQQPSTWANRHDRCSPPGERGGSPQQKLVLKNG